MLEIQSKEEGEKDWVLEEIDLLDPAVLEADTAGAHAACIPPSYHWIPCGWVLVPEVGPLELKHYSQVIPSCHDHLVKEKDLCPSEGSLGPQPMLEKERPHL